MCSWSFRFYMLIWQVLDSLLPHLLLMMSHDCPLAIRHKKGEYILCMETGEVFFFVLFWGKYIAFMSFFDVFLFIWLKMYLFLRVVYVRGRHYVLCFFYCFLFHMWYIGHWSILRRYSWYMPFIFYFVKSRIFFCFTCIFHTCVYMFVECFKYIQVNKVVLLSILATDR